MARVMLVRDSTNPRKLGHELLALEAWQAGMAQPSSAEEPTGKDPALSRSESFMITT